ncbi:MAG: ribonuclease R, partial [Alphaproteobacteria bacterium]|nr:ribonuclease R [Alphaproteobacteria bacterium]
MNERELDRRTARRILARPGAFLWRVVRVFRANQGLLLAGAVAYYTLLSIVPMFGLLLVGLSQLVDPALLLQTIQANL